MDLHILWTKLSKIEGPRRQPWDINGKIRIEDEARALGEDQGTVEQCHAHS